MAPTTRATRSKSPAAHVAKSPGSVKGRKSRGQTPTALRSLPWIHANTLLKRPGQKIHPVKEQTLNLEVEKILIYRQKVPTPKGVSGHIIRRTDTDAVSASSLFRTAFPAASMEQETEEMQFVCAKYDSVKAGRENEAEGTGRLTGKWIPTADAKELAAEYGLLKFASDLLTYTPLNGDKPQTDSDSVSPTADHGDTSIDSSMDSPQPTRSSKRLRMGSPAPQSTKPVTVEQSIVTDPTSGLSTETTTVLIEAPSAEIEGKATEQQTLDAIESAKELVETLKKEHLLKTLPSEDAAASSSAAARGKKRSIQDAAASDPIVRKKGWFGRERQIAGVVAASAAQPATITPRNRRILSFAGLALVGAATAAAPYFFG